jgi:hypothetical protein
MSEQYASSLAAVPIRIVTSRVMGLAEPTVVTTGVEPIVSTGAMAPWAPAMHAGWVPGGVLATPSASVWTAVAGPGSGSSALG